MSTDYPETAIAWVDVETTGLVGHKNRLLEVACRITDLDLNFVDDGGYQSAVFAGTVDEVAELRESTHPDVQKMHDTTGLWGRVSHLESSKPRAVVDRELLAYIQRFVPEQRTARLAGNSVRLDLNFLEEHLPKTYGHLHYRMADVSTVAGLSQWWNGVPLFEKQRKHEAMSDIAESVAEMRYLKEQVFDRALRAPLYIHDCDTCIWLGTHQDPSGAHDLYVHRTGIPTYIARRSSEDSDYLSGAVYVGQHPAITEAHRRAVERGVDISDEVRRQKGLAYRDPIPGA